MRRQIGELVSQLSDEVKAQNKAIPWRIIKDTRSFYVHAYGSIDIPPVWDTLVDDIPALKTACEEILTHVIVIGNPLKESLDFPPLHTGHATFTASGVPSIVLSGI